MHQSSKKGGFTLIELMLSMAFIGSLLLVIAAVVMQVTSIYNRGLTIKEVNAVSRVLVRDMQQSIMNSEVFALRYHRANPTPQDIMATNFNQARSNGTDFYSNPAGGRLCTGTYSYAWNSGRAVKSHASEGSINYEGSNPIQFMPDGSIIRFVKVRDTQKELCRSTNPNAASRLPVVMTADGVPSPVLNVFGSGNNNLVLYKIDIDAPGDAVTGNENVSLKSTAPYYTISMIVGSQMGDEVIHTVEPNCNAPDGGSMNDGEYCAINKISFVARSGAGR